MPAVANKTTSSFSLSAENVAFLENYSRKLEKKKSSLVNTALQVYQKYVLYMEMRKGFSKRNTEDVAFAEMGMNDFHRIITTSS